MLFFFSSNDLVVLSTLGTVEGLSHTWQIMVGGGGAIGWTGKRIMYCNYLCVRLSQPLTTRFCSPVLRLQCYKQAGQKRAEHNIWQQERGSLGKFSEMILSVFNSLAFIQP